MAKVSNVRLSMGRTSKSQEFGEVTFDIQFSGQEVSENLEFGLYIYLMEIDGDLDIYHLYPNGHRDVSITRKAEGNQDDFITWITSEIIRPNGSNTLSLTRRKGFDVGNQEAGEEEYRALVWVIPEIVDGKAWSNVLPINLG